MGSIQDIIEIRDKIKLAKKERCECSSIAIQLNQGCECKVGRKINALKEELENLIDNLSNEENDK